MERTKWNKTTCFHVIIMGYLIMLTIGNVLSFAGGVTDLALKDLFGVITGIVFFYAVVFLTSRETGNENEYRKFVSWMFWGMGLNAMAFYFIIWLNLKVPVYSQFGFNVVWICLIAYGFGGFLVGKVFSKLFRLAILKLHRKDVPAQLPKSGRAAGQSALPDQKRLHWKSYVIPVCFIILITLGNIYCMIRWERIWRTGVGSHPAVRGSSNFFTEVVKWIPYFWGYVWRFVGCCFFFGLAIYLCLNQSPVKWRRYVGMIVWGVGGNALTLYCLRTFEIVHTANYLYHLYEFLIPYGFIALFAGTVLGLVIRKIGNMRNKIWAKP